MEMSTLFYYEDVLERDVENLRLASMRPDEVSEEDFKRALNVKLDAIRADTVNIQHLLDS